MTVRWKIPLVSAACLLGLCVLAVAAAAFRFRHRPFRPSSSPAVTAGGSLRLRYTGVSGYELGDGATTVLLDPVATRPPIWRLLLGPLSEDPAPALALFPKADFILVNHAHYDHLIDAPAIALARGAMLVGTRSVCGFARSRGLPTERCREVRGGETLRLGTFTVRVGRSVHAPILGVREPMSGVIPDDAGRLWFNQFKLDGALSYHLSAGGTRVFFHPTSTFAPGEAAGFDAETLVLGVTGEAMTAAKLAGLAAEMPGVRLVLPTHYDNFFQPLSRGLALMPGLDLAGLEAMVRAAMPQAAFAVLDYGQTVSLP